MTNNHIHNETNIEKIQLFTLATGQQCQLPIVKVKTQQLAEVPFYILSMAF